MSYIEIRNKQVKRSIDDVAIKKKYSQHIYTRLPRKLAEGKYTVNDNALKVVQI